MQLLPLLCTNDRRRTETTLNTTALLVFFLLILRGLPFFPTFPRSLSRPFPRSRWKPFFCSLKISSSLFSFADRRFRRELLP